MTDVIDLSKFRDGRQPPQGDAAKVREDEDYLDLWFNRVRGMVQDHAEMDLEHITQPNGVITFEDMIACGISTLSKVLRDFPYKLYPALGWDRGHRRTKIGLAPGYESRMRRLEEEGRELRRLLKVERGR